MEGLTAWVSHYGIFLIAAAGAAALLCAFLARGKKLRWGAAAGVLLCAAAAVWYFLPFSVPLDPQRTSVLLQFTLGEPLELTQEEREEVLRLCGELTYFRRPGQTVLRTGGTETAYLILLQGGDGGSSESLHLTLALSPEGFAGEDGLHGVNQNLDGVRGQEPLVEYVRALADKYEIPLAE